MDKNTNFDFETKIENKPKCKFNKDPINLFYGFLGLAEGLTDKPVTSANNAVLKLTGYNLMELMDIDVEFMDNIYSSDYHNKVNLAFENVENSEEPNSNDEVKTEFKH